MRMRFECLARGRVVRGSLTDFHELGEVPKVHVEWKRDADGGFDSVGHLETLVALRGGPGAA